MINHGAWAAAAGGVGLAVAGSAAGTDWLGPVILTGLCISVLSGVVCTTLPAGPVSSGFGPLHVPLVGAALAVAFICFIALGRGLSRVEPRFSRLAAAD